LCRLIEPKCMRHLASRTSFPCLAQ
jgi:hypothetical protein